MLSLNNEPKSMRLENFQNNKLKWNQKFHDFTIVILQRISAQQPTFATQRFVSPSRTSKYSGKDLRVHPGLLMVTGTSPHAARENAIAILWSSNVSISVTFNFSGGLIMQKSGPSSTSAPNYNNAKSIYHNHY